MKPGETLIEMALRHVAEGEDHVRKQIQVIERLRKAHAPTNEAEDLLEEFRQTLDDHRESVKRIREEQRTGFRDSAGEPILPRPFQRG